MRKTKKAAIKIAPYITGILLVLVIGGATLILLWPNITSDVPMSAPRASVDDDKTKDMVKITLGANGGVPYKWRYTISEPSVLEYFDLVSTNENPDMDGGPVILDYYFKPLTAGNATILFEYYDFAHDDATIEKTKEYYVEVKDDLTFEIKEVQTRNE